MQTGLEVPTNDQLLGKLKDATKVRWEAAFDGQNCYRFYTKDSFSEARAREIAEMANGVLKIQNLTSRTCVRNESHHTFYVAVTREKIKPVTTTPNTPVPLPAISPTDGRLRLNFREIQHQTDELRRSFKFAYVPNRFDPLDRGTGCPEETQLKKDKTSIRSIDEDGIESSREVEPLFFLHANHLVLGPISLVCSQAPVPSGVEEFWKAALKYTHLILDLTNKTDRLEKNVQRYYPHEADCIENTHDYKSVRVVYVREEENVGANKRLKKHVYDVLDLSCEGAKPVCISRLHYRGWPDGGVIDVRELHFLVTILRGMTEELRGKPLWSHCAAGVGRSGTIATALALAAMKAQGLLTQSTDIKKLLEELILSGRKQRGHYFVQSEEQYALLYAYAQFLIKP